MKLTSLLFIAIVVSVIISSNTLSTSYNTNNVVLLTGFEPFDNWEKNPSQIVVEILNGTIINNKTIIGLVLPVNYSKAFSKLIAAINEYHPSTILNFGLSGTAREIEIEQIAINVKRDSFMSFSLIINGNNLFYKSTLPSDLILRNSIENNIKTRISYFAGFYLCNFVMYQTLDYIASNNIDAIAGFIHLPPLDEQASFGLTINEILNAAEIIIKSCTVN